MKKITGFSLVEVLTCLVILGFIASVSMPVLMTNSSEKIYLKGYKTAYEEISKQANAYFLLSMNSLDSTKESAEYFAKFLIENMDVQTLYAEKEPDSKSNTYAALKFSTGLEAGATNPNTVSPIINITSSPEFWFVTSNNLAYSVIIPNNAQCREILNINTANNLDNTLTASCLAVVVDTNGLAKNPNKIEDMQDISKEEYMPNLKNDRYYIFIGNNGAATGNPAKILSAKILSEK